VRPNPLQRDIVRAIKRGAQLIAIQAGWGSGKTSGIATALGLVNEMRGGCRLAWIMDRYQRAIDVSIPECEKWLEARGWARAESGLRWNAPNGGSVVLRNFYAAAGEDGRRLEGLNLGAAAIDECQDLPPSALKRMVGRVGRDGSGPPLLILAGLPVPKAWWVRAAENHPHGVVIKATSHANAENLPPEFFANARAALTAREYEAMVENRPMPPKGQVYAMFREEEWPAGNLLSEFVPTGRDCVVAADFGVDRPAAALIAWDPVREVDVIVDDVQPDGVSVYEFADLVAARIRHHRMRLSRVVGDPAGNARSAAHPEKATQAGIFVARLREQFEQAVPPMLFTTERDRRSIPAGVLCLGARFASADGARRLVVWTPSYEREAASAEARTLAGCIGGYAYPASGGDMPKKDGRHDHLMDALRYWACVLRWVSPKRAPSARDLMPAIDDLDDDAEWLDAR